MHAYEIGLAITGVMYLHYIIISFDSIPSCVPQYYRIGEIKNLQLQCVRNQIVVFNHVAVQHSG